MRVKIIVLGKLKEAYWKLAEEEYLKRLRPYVSIELIELKEQSGKDGVSLAEELQLLEREWEAVSKHIQPSDVVYCLDVHGEIISSEKLSEKIDVWKIHQSSTRNLVFVVGGPAGLSNSLRGRADWLWSMSKLTFTHQMVRVLLLEQLYRSQKIARKEPYHK